MPTIQKDSNHFSRSRSLPCTCATRLWYLSVNERADLSEKSPSSCFTVGWRCALPREQTGRLAQSPHAATVETLDPPQWPGSPLPFTGVTPSRGDTLPSLPISWLGSNPARGSHGSPAAGFYCARSDEMHHGRSFSGLKGWSARRTCGWTAVFASQYLQAWVASVSWEEGFGVSPRSPAQRETERKGLSSRSLDDIAQWFPSTRPCSMNGPVWLAGILYPRGNVERESQHRQPVWCEPYSSRYFPR